jgi:hypothetical protein
MKRFEELTKQDLTKLRKEIVLNSLYISDYRNSFGFREDSVCAFFEGYVDYITELAEEDGFVFTDNNFFDMVNKYDTEDNLLSWYYCYEDFSWVKYDCFFIGDKVKWADPGIEDYDEEDREDVLNRVFEIIAINGDVITIAEVGGGSEAEVFEDELTLA